MNTIISGWQPYASYVELEVKPPYAVFFFPAVEVAGVAMPELVTLSSVLPARLCTYWHPITDIRTMDLRGGAALGQRIKTGALTAKQVAVLNLLLKGKVNFHAAVLAGANLATMSGLVKAGLATPVQGSAVKQWQISEAGRVALRESDPAASCE